MKKKNILLIVCSVVIVLAIIAIAVFLHFTKNVESDNTIEGTWRVVTHNTDPTNPESIIQYTENQYMTFEDGKIYYYVSGECQLTGDYSYKNSEITISNAQTEIESFPEQFVVQTLSGSSNYMKLIDEIKIQDWQLLKTISDGTNETPVTEEKLSGKWNVVMHGNSPVSDEWIEFDTTAKNMTNHRPSGDTTLAYNWVSDTVINFEGFGEFALCNISDDSIAMIQLGDNCNIWELAKAK